MTQFNERPPQHAGLMPTNSKEITPSQLYATLAPKQLFTFYIQLIVSTQELHPAHFTQSSLEDVSTNPEQSKVLSLPGDWLIKTLEVVVRRKE